MTTSNNTTTEQEEDIVEDLDSDSSEEEKSVNARARELFSTIDVSKFKQPKKPKKDQNASFWFGGSVMEDDDRPQKKSSWLPQGSTMEDDDTLIRTISNPSLIHRPGLTESEQEQIDKQFRAMCEQAGYRDEYIEQYVKQLPYQVKAETVKQYSISRKNDQNFEAEIDKFVETSTAHISLQQLRNLMLIVGTRTNYPLEYFLSTKNGMEKIQLILEQSGYLMQNKAAHEIEFLSQVIALIKMICTTKLGMNKLIDNSKVVKLILLLFDVSDLKLKTEIVSLLSLATVYQYKDISQETHYGFDTVLSAFDHYKLIKSERKRFSHLVDGMKKNAVKEDFVVKCLCLINALISYANHSALQLILEKQFLDLGINDFLEDIIRRNDSISPNLRAQIEVFQKNLSNAYDVQMDTFNDPTKLASAIHLKLSGEKASQNFLNLMQYLYIHATQHDSPELLNDNWQTLDTVVKRCVTSGKDGRFEELTPKELKMQQKLQLQEQHIASIEVRNKKQVEILADKLKGWKKDLENLASVIPENPNSGSSEDEEVAKTFEALKHVQSFVGEMKVVHSKQIQHYESELFKLNQHIADLKSKIVTLKQDKGIADDPKEAESKPEEIHAVVPIIAMPPMALPPPPPPPPMPFGAPGMKPLSHGLPTLPVWKKNEQTRNLHWEAINQAQVRETVFIKKNIATGLADISLEQEKIEQLFSSKPKKQAPVMPKPAPVQRKTIIDQKRAYNISIIIKNVRMSYEDIRNGILSADMNKLTAENLETLLKIVPTPEEIDIVSSYEGKVAELSEPEQFFIAIKDIPNIEGRLRSLHFRYRFSVLTAIARPDIASISKACKEVLDGKSFMEFLKVVLAIGNFLNGGNKGVYGFKVGSLLKLPDTRTADNKSNLLNYIVSHLKDKQSECVKFTEEFNCIDIAAKLDMHKLREYIKELQNGLVLVDKQIKSLSELPKPIEGDEFVPVMTEFYKKAFNQMSQISEQYEQMLADCQETAKLFMEDPAKITDFFSVLSQFKALVLESSRKYDEQKRHQERQAEQILRNANKKTASIKIKLPINNNNNNGNPANENNAGDNLLNLESEMTTGALFVDRINKMREAMFPEDEWEDLSKESSEFE